LPPPPRGRSSRRRSERRSSLSTPSLRLRSPPSGLASRLGRGRLRSGFGVVGRRGLRNLNGRLALGFLVGALRVMRLLALWLGLRDLLRGFLVGLGLLRRGLRLGICLGLCLCLG